MQVIAETTGTKPSVSELAEDKAKFSKEIHKFINNRMKDPAFAELIQEFSLYYFTPYKSAFDFNSFKEYVEYAKQVELRSLKGDKVRSFEECFIANFLYINDIDYIYEKPYEIKTADTNHRQYRPDFYLPENQRSAQGTQEDRGCGRSIRFIWRVRFDRESEGRHNGESQERDHPAGEKD